jgi:hypothetical protein
MKPTLSLRIQHPADLTHNELSNMFALFSQYYGACTLQNFINDMSEKDYVFLMQDTQTADIVGFTTALVMPLNINSRQIYAIYSGDTIIHHRYRGSQQLLLSWCTIAGQLKAKINDAPLFWFLIVKGYRTYRYLPLFTRRFYPNWRYPTPTRIQQILDTMATAKFGNAYQPDKGLIRFEHSKGHLKGQWADVPAHLTDKPDIQYFLERNPGYHVGDELACITELTEANLKSHALRAFRGGMH